MKKSHLVVTNHHPLIRRFMLVGACVGVLLLAFVFYELGRYQAGFNLFEVADERARLEAKIEELTKTNSGLSEQVTILGRSQAIDREAYDVVRTDLKQLQEEILELREEVEFYRGIVSPVERQAGLNIQTFKLELAGEEGLYHFELVMSQVLKNDRYVKGVVKLYVQGVQEGEPLTLNFSDISPNDSVGQNFRFRYFQRMEGDIRLPENFLPRNVMVEMAPEGRKQISKSFPWQMNGAK